MNPPLLQPMPAGEQIIFPLASPITITIQVQMQILQILEMLQKYFVKKKIVVSALYKRFVAETIEAGLTSLTNRWTESRGDLRDGWARDWTRKKEMDKKGSLMRSQCHTTVSTVHHHRQASAIFLMCHNYFAIIWLAFSQHQRGPKTGSAVSTAIISRMRRKEFQVLPSRHSFHSSTVGN